jgi:hypothetical protein
MSETAAPTATETREMFLVAYYMSDSYDKTCSWCDDPGVVRIVATPGELTDYACEDCAAGHLRGNADVIGTED